MDLSSGVSGQPTTVGGDDEPRESTTAAIATTGASSALQGRTSKMKWKACVLVGKFIRIAAQMAWERKRSLSQGMSVGDDDEEFLATQFGDKRSTRLRQTSSMNKDDTKTDDEITPKPHGDSKSFEDAELVVGPQGAEDPSFYEEDEEPTDLLHLSFSDFIVDPTGDLYYCWQGLVGVSVFYNIIFTVMRIAFEQLDSYWWLFWTLDVLTDLVYAADMFVQMNISYIDDGIYVTDKKQLKEHYLNTRQYGNN